MRTAASPHTVHETVQRVLQALARHSVPQLAHIDHGAAAAAAGMDLGDEVLLIFGDARVGTLLMQTDPRIGYDLPLRLLIWSAEGQTTIGFQPPPTLADTYDIAEHGRVLAGMEALLQALVTEAIAGA